MDWGTVPAWVGAVGTVAAFAVTYALLRHEIRARRDEVRDQERRQAHDEKRQARLAWIDGLGMDASSADGDVTVVTQPKVHNDSDETIRDVFVKLYDERGQHLGDTQPASIVLSPHQNVMCYLRVEVPDERALGDRTASAELFFTDADGRRWKRSGDQTRLSRQLEG